jgi:hypothetical protein
MDLSEIDHERLEREADAALIEQLETEADDQASRLKHCLHAIVSAGVPLDCKTATVLQELGAKLQYLIHSAFEECES